MGKESASHVMASGALPPGFPPVEIDGAYYWDGGIMSNTPLQYVADDLRINALIVQVDLFSGRGELPKNLNQVQERAKDIQYQSKQRFSYARIEQIEAFLTSLWTGKLSPKVVRALSVYNLTLSATRPSELAHALEPQLEVLLEGAVANPETRIGDLPILAADEARAILELARPSGSAPTCRDVATLVEEQVTRVVEGTGGGSSNGPVPGL